MHKCTPKSWLVLTIVLGLIFSIGAVALDDEQPTPGGTKVPNSICKTVNCHGYHMTAGKPCKWDAAKQKVVGECTFCDGSQVGDICVLTRQNEECELKTGFGTTVRCGFKRESVCLKDLNVQFWGARCDKTGMADGSRCDLAKCVNPDSAVVEGEE